MSATWVLVDCHQCNWCGHLDTDKDGMMAHLALHDREARPDDDIPYAEIYDRLMEAEDTVARVRALLAPAVSVGDMPGIGPYRHESTPVHIKARDLRAALEREAGR